MKYLREKWAKFMNNISEKNTNGALNCKNMFSFTDNQRNQNVTLIWPCFLKTNKQAKMK